MDDKLVMISSEEYAGLIEKSVKLRTLLNHLFEKSHIASYKRELIFDVDSEVIQALFLMEYREKFEMESAKDES